MGINSLKEHDDILKFTKQSSWQNSRTKLLGEEYKWSERVINNTFVHKNLKRSMQLNDEVGENNFEWFSAPIDK